MTPEREKELRDNQCSGGCYCEGACEMSRELFTEIDTLRSQLKEVIAMSILSKVEIPESDFLPENQMISMEIYERVKAERDALRTENEQLKARIAELHATFL